MRAWPFPDLPVVSAETGAATTVRPVPQVRDTATGGLVPAGPSTGTARMYVCGITPYDATHLGHAMTYLTFDLLNRVWRDAGLEVVYVQNITDVDDPLLERAAATGVDWRELAESQIQLFRDDNTALRIIPPEHYIGAVESIDLVDTVLATLEVRGSTYRLEDGTGDWYFDPTVDPGFGSLSHLSEERARATFAERGGDPERPGKRHPLDALVWRGERAEEPSWPSSYGDGRPGWHIECTAIALEHLGPDFDVQGGGTDLVFPHHEMSASHGRVATGEPFAKAYVHVGMVGLDGEKMSKSQGNLVLVSKLLQAGVDPMAIRLALLAHRYAEEWSWTDTLLRSAEQRLARWRSAVRLDAARGGAEVVAQLRAALAADLDAPTALAVVDAWAGASLADGPDRARLDPGAPAEVAAAVDALLGIKL
ncbi:MAG: cysteine--1-D-myo-inosityl 2-amino-2-deoxy-alpha-D-glucopyranoside ligase [Propionibacteriaceae bacterium]